MKLHYRSYLSLSLLRGAALATAVDLSNYVLTDTGTTGGGNDFPGVSMPYGMVKLGPDLHTGRDSYSGYKPSGRVMGFSMTHETGTGGAPKYGVVAQMPALDAVDINWSGEGYEERAKDQPDVTEIGYYLTTLESGIVTELSATEKAGIFKYTFPSGQGRPSVIVEVSHVLPSFRGNNWGQSYKGGKIMSIGQNGILKYQGWGEYDNGWNIAPTWRIYFCGHFDAPGEYASVLEGSSVGELRANGSELYESQEGLGMIYYFDKATTQVSSRVGISFISEEQACQNVAIEIPEGTDIVDVRGQVRETWNNKVLSRVTTVDTNEENLRSLYTSIYFMHLIPTNKTGENPAWQQEKLRQQSDEDSVGDEPYFDDIFTLWDTFRCTTPLFHILQPEAYEQFIRSLIGIYRHDGYMPDARSSFWNGAVQGGSNADNVLADAYVKGVRGTVDWDVGLQALLKDAEVIPEPNKDPRDGRSDSTKEGRGALQDWLDYGYLTKKFSRSASRAVEYAVNDFAVYQVASDLGLETAGKYLRRSRNWRNQWNPNMEAHGFKGFIGPRAGDGNHEFISQSPLSCGGCYWGDDYYQGTPWMYTFNVHHDIRALIKLSGGAEEFEARLNTTFSNEYYDATNEPSFTTPYLYHFVGRPELSVVSSREYAKTRFSNTPSGLPGNSDAGAMQSWLLWAMIGLYPMTGQTTFLIGSPWFSNLEISLDDAGSKRVIINSTGGGYSSFHVQSVRLNGEPWTKSWIVWSDLFESGGTLEFELGTQPREWATGPLPPSPATEDDESLILTAIDNRSDDSPEESEPENNRDLEKVYIAACIVGGVVLLSLIGGGVWLWSRRKRFTARGTKILD